MTAIYFATRYSRLPEMQECAAELRERDYKVVCRWIEGDHRLPDDANHDAESRRLATEDYEDVCACDVLVCFTEDSTRHPPGTERRPPPDAVEEWRPCSELHEVSSFGRVRSHRLNNVLTGWLTNGYRRVALRKGESVFVHQLVAAAFLGAADGREVHHMDDDKENNWLGNLVYMTHAEHMATQRGQERNGEWKTKLTWSDVYDIRVRLWAGEPKRTIARDYEVSPTTVRDISQGKTWRVDPRGGFHVEFGIAFGQGKRCVVVGPRTNVFHHLPEVPVYDSWLEALEAEFPRGR